MPRAVADDLPKHFSRLLHRVGRLDRLHGLHPRHLPLLHVGLPHHGRGLKLCYSRVLRSNPGSNEIQTYSGQPAILGDLVTRIIRLIPWLSLGSNTLAIPSWGRTPLSSQLYIEVANIKGKHCPAWPQMKKSELINLLSWQLGLTTKDSQESLY